MGLIETSSYNSKHCVSSYDPINQKDEPKESQRNSFKKKAVAAAVVSAIALTALAIAHHYDYDFNKIFKDATKHAQGSILDLFIPATEKTLTVCNRSTCKAETYWNGYKINEWYSNKTLGDNTVDTKMPNLWIPNPTTPIREKMDIDEEIQDNIVQVSKFQSVMSGFLSVFNSAIEFFYNIPEYIRDCLASDVQKQTTCSGSTCIVEKFRDGNKVGEWTTQHKLIPFKMANF